MSLVNDMLRDLDQRRKSSDSSGSVNLMPASDMPVEKKNRILLIVSVALLVVVSGLAYLWSQQSGVSQPRQLNISPPVATAPAETESSSAEEGVEERASAGQSEVSGTAASAPVARNIAQQTDPSGSSASAAAANGEGAALASRPVIPEIPRVQAPAQATSGQSVQAGGVNEGADEGVADKSVNAGAATDAVAQNEPAAQESAPSQPTPTAVSTRSVINQPPQESVKNDAQMSAEQLDTMAVQAALRMIADNNISGAYAHLEQHVIQNRYAHQSRETYAKLLVNEGELLAAYNLVESGLGLAPNHPGFKKVKARILIADGQIPEAVNLLASRAPSIEDDLEYHEILATAQLASRDYRGALLSYESLVQQDQSQGRWWYGYAASQDSLGNIRAARQAYNRAVQQAGLSPNLRRRSQERLAALSDE